MIIGIGQVPDPEWPSVGTDIFSHSPTSRLSSDAEECVYRAVLWDRCKSGDVAYISPPPLMAAVVRPGRVEVEDPRRKAPFPAGVPVYICEEIARPEWDKSQIYACRGFLQRLDELYPKWMPERAQVVREIVDAARKGYKRATGKSPSSADLAPYLALMVPAEETAGDVPSGIPGGDRAIVNVPPPGRVDRPAEVVPAWAWLVGGGVVLYLLLSKGGTSK